MAITGFEVGHYYRWIGPRDYCEDWASEMEPWKDGNARKCTAFDGLRAEFDGIEDCWYYGHCLQHFEEVASPTTETSKELTEREKLERIAAGSCKGFGCSGCPLFDFRITSGGDPCCEQEHCDTKLAPRARARARELLGRTTESTPGTIGRSFTITIIPQTLVEKRRATRRRLLGL
jgi:hypothetical protein